MNRFVRSFIHSFNDSFSGPFLLHLGVYIIDPSTSHRIMRDNELLTVQCIVEGELICVEQQGREGEKELSYIMLAIPGGPYNWMPRTCFIPEMREQTVWSR